MRIPVDLISRDSTRIMSAKLLYLMLGALLLVQCTYGNAIGAKTTEATAEEDEKLQTAGIEYIGTTLLEMFNLIDKTFNASRIAFEPIFTELAATGDAAKTDMQVKVVELKKLLDRMGKLDNEEIQPAKADFIDELGKIFNDFKKTEEQAESLTDFDKNVLKVQENLRTDLQEALAKFCDNIVNAAEKYWNSMSAKKQEEEQKFHDAITQLKNEQDIQKKAELLKNFIALNDSDEQNN